MSEYTVEVLEFDDLSEAEQMGASNNGTGKQYATYLRVSHGGKVLFLESDACEPEDKTFNRDLGWIVWALTQAYQLGAADAQGKSE